MNTLHKRLTVYPAIFAIGSLLMLQACSSAHEMDSYTNDQAMDLRDSDNDGVINARDICANTPLTSEIDGNGCSQWQIEERSDDFVLEFDMDKDQVLPAHQPLLADIEAFMRQDPSARILLVGDTSPEGSDEYNKALGKRRADNVTDALIEAGVRPDHILGFVYTDAYPQTLLKKRMRRTIVRVLHGEEESIDKWTIFTVENARKE